MKRFLVLLAIQHVILVLVLVITHVIVVILDTIIFQTKLHAETVAPRVSLIIWQPLIVLIVQQVVKHVLILLQIASAAIVQLIYLIQLVFLFVQQDMEL